MSKKLGPASGAAVTITAELSDAFRTKRDGINFVLDAIQTALPNTSLHFFGVDGRFHSPSAVAERPLLFAAANWLATGLLVAQHFRDGLLVDIGSTTTDIVPFSAGQVVAAGRTDPERLVRGELLYTGALRTPVFAVVQQVPLWGRWCPVAAEFFATMQDVYLWLKRLAPQECTSPTADGRPLSMQFCAERLARVVCADAELLTPEEITVLARYVAQTQLHQITNAIAQVCSATGINGPVIGVGVGAFLAEQAARQLDLTFIRPVDVLGPQGLTVAPAAAVAFLLAQQETHV
jgi:probable H4MPT-linked C1 transfer pathway protein